MILSSQHGRSQSEKKKTKQKKGSRSCGRLLTSRWQVALLRCTTGREGNAWSRVQPLLGACLSRKGRVRTKSPKFTVCPGRVFPQISPLSVYNFLVLKPGVWVCAITCLTDINLICKSLMFNQRRVVLLVGAKGPYRCIYGTAGTFKATVTVQPNLCMGREEEEGRRFMDGRWSAPTIIYRSEGGREDQAQAALQRFCTDSRERAKEAVIKT